MYKPMAITIGSILLVTSLAACGGQASSSNTTSVSSKNQKPTQSQSIQASTSPTAEKPVAAEKNPLGDIPDSQAFISYTAQNNVYGLVVPEGWARSTNGTTVQFVSKLDGVKVSEETPFSSSLTVENVKLNWIPKLQKNERAVKVESVTKVQVPAGDAIRVVYSSNSEPNSVTGKQLRLEDNAYLYQKNNTLEIISLWAPYGADNVDQWKKISDSFRWK